MFRLTKNIFLNQYKIKKIIDGSPIMDGKIHRVKITNDKGRELSGAYIGYLNNNFPAGFIQNFKTGIKKNWKMQIEKNQNNNIKSPKKLHEQIKKDQEFREKAVCLKKNILTRN